jgi:hypothetical protein
MEGMMRMMGFDGANGGGGDEADDKLYISEYAGKWKNQFSWRSNVYNSMLDFLRAQPLAIKY